MVSQYFDQVYVTFAACHDDYIRYLQEGEITPNAFLVMQKFGPFWTTSHGDMHALAILITALTLRVKEEC